MGGIRKMLFDKTKDRCRPPPCNDGPKAAKCQANVCETDPCETKEERDDYCSAKKTNPRDFSNQKPACCKPGCSVRMPCLTCIRSGCQVFRPNYESCKKENIWERSKPKAVDCTAKTRSRSEPRNKRRNSDRCKPPAESCEAELPSKVQPRERCLPNRSTSCGRNSAVIRVKSPSLDRKKSNESCEKTQSQTCSCDVCKSVSFNDTCEEIPNAYFNDSACTDPCETFQEPRVARCQTPYQKKKVRCTSRDPCGRSDCRKSTCNPKTEKDSDCKCSKCCKNAKKAEQCESKNVKAQIGYEVPASYLPPTMMPQCIGSVGWPRCGNAFFQ